ncbi:glycosyltransferase family 2 protein [Azorhizophilus paspali]
MRAIWQRYCEGKEPAALTIDKQGEARFADDEHPMHLLHPATEKTTLEEAEVFRFAFEGKIVTVDNGSILTSTPGFTNLQKLGAFATIAFDPSSKVKNAQQLQQQGELHHYPHVVLGDGQDATLHVCLDPAMSATLEPLPADEQLSGNKQATRVIARLPISTLRLDDIEGLESVDWLLLDNLNDSLAILESGEKALANTLLVQVRVNFFPTHQNQPELTQISHWLSRHGFSFYRLNNLQHYSHQPKRDDLLKQQATQLIGADALFIPSQQRIETLDTHRRAKLAFILHSVYQIHDLTFSLLDQEKTSSGEKYLESNGYLKKTNPTINEKQKARVYINSGKPKICIGVPVYNEESHIHETVASLKRQNIDGIKFIFSDNASTDKTYEIAKSLSSDDPRFEITRNSENVGAADNFINLFKDSSSEYFMWLGAHDCLSENYIAETARILDNNKSVSMACGYPFGIMNGRAFGPVEEAIYDFKQPSPADRYLSSVATLSNCTVFHSLFRRKDLDGFEFRKTISMDHTIISRLLWKGILQYSENAKYFRRYFQKRESTVEERILGREGSLERNDFFDHHISDLEKLQGAQRNEKLIKKVEMILKSRFK